VKKGVKAVGKSQTPAMGREKGGKIEVKTKFPFQRCVRQRRVCGRKSGLVTRIEGQF